MHPIDELYDLCGKPRDDSWDVTDIAKMAVERINELQSELEEETQSSDRCWY